MTLIHSTAAASIRDAHSNASVTSSKRWRATALSILITVVGGALLPAQAAINGALAGTLRSVTLTGAISYLTGATLLYLAMRVQRQPPDWRTALAAPRWAWLGGCLGSAYVVGSVTLTRALGAALATTLMIAAQLVAAVLLDHVGAFELPQRRINRARVVAMLLVFASLVLRLQGHP